MNDAIPWYVLALRHFFDFIECLVCYLYLFVKSTKSWVYFVSIYNKVVGLFLGLFLGVAFV